MTHSDPSPVNPLPAQVWVLVLCIALPEAVFLLAEAGIIGGPEAVGWRLAALNAYAFSGQAFDFMLFNGVLLSEHLLRFLTYPFVDVRFTGVLITCVIVLAMGKLIGEVMGGWSVWLIFVLCSITGSVVMGVSTDQQWLSGAYPGAYGLIGTFTFLYWQKQVASGGPQSQAFLLIGILMGLQLVFAILSAFAGANPSYVWVAELSGAATGFGLAAFVLPGGMQRLLNALRRR